MSADVKLMYRRVGAAYHGVFETNVAEDRLPFECVTFAEMMTQAHRFLVKYPDAGLVLNRTDRTGLLPAQLEPNLLKLLREDPVAYIKANTIPDRVIDLRGDRKSALSANDGAQVPRSSGLRHGLDTLAEAFGEVVYAKAKQMTGGLWRYEHPGTGRWSDLNTIEHWLRSHDTSVMPTSDHAGYLLIKVELLLRTGAERFYYPREWNEFGSWITKEQLQTKLDQFKKDKANGTR